MSCPSARRACRYWLPLTLLSSAMTFASVSPPQTGMQEGSADWWTRAVVYEVYPRSFKDADGDGVGDLDGITSKLDYLADIGIDAIWITPFFPSPQVDFGYDVSDFENVDPQFGTLEDFDHLVAEAHKRNIRVLCDLVLNHTSDQHPYFVESRSSRDNPKSDWYVWRNPAPGGGPPNNWLSIFGGSAWTFDKTRGQYYYHFFYPEQPDINWRNPDAANAIFDSVRFWLRRGVNGFRVDAIDHVFEDRDLRDNPTTGRMREDGTPEQEYRYTSRVAENHQIFQRLREVVDEFPNRVIMGETGAPPAALEAYYGPARAEFNLPFNFALMDQRTLDAAAYRSLVAGIERVLGDRPVNYVLSNHDRPRSWDTFGDGVHNDQIAKLMLTMLLTLRGVPFVYYGEEIGMKTTVPERVEDVRDPVGKVFWPKNKGRDGERTPMQWTPGSNAGFSTAAKTWLPVPETAGTRNVETMSKDATSLLSFFKQATRLRRASSALLEGAYESIGDDPNVFVYRRQSSSQTMIVALNMSSGTHVARLGRHDLGGPGGRLRLALGTLTGPLRQTDDGVEITLAGYESAVLEVVAKQTAEDLRDAQTENAYVEHPPTAIPLVVQRVARNIQAEVCQTEEGTVCSVTLRPCTDDGGQPELLVNGDRAIRLDETKVAELLADIAPPWRTGSSTFKAITKSSRLEFSLEKFEHASIMKSYSSKQLDSVSVHWFGLVCNCVQPMSTN